MNLHFSKYSATGNDFIIIDNRQNNYDPSQSLLWKRFCQRRFSVGANGIIFLERSEKADFRMVYLNSDGKEAEMCGNGARAILHFAHFCLKMKKENTYQFETKNKIYSGIIKNHCVELRMLELFDIDKIEIGDLYITDHSLSLNTGVPHVVVSVETVDDLDVSILGEKMSHDRRFPNGTNVNFIEVVGKQKIKIRTYERGLEEETLSCGTGVTAAGIACSQFFNWKDKITVLSRGGDLFVKFTENFEFVYLLGKVDEIYRATAHI